MTPPIQKDWWLAAALTGAALPAAIGQTPSPAGGRQTGVVTTVTQGTASRGVSAPLYIENTKGQKLVTGPNQTLHVLFSDQSALTVGPNSEVTIAEYRFDSKTKEGNVLVDMTKGLLRVVGGLISKKNDTVVRTATATVGIRGGISIVETQANGDNSSTFLFGQHMNVQGQNGQTTNINRPGFGINIRNGQPSAPQRMSAETLNNQLGRLDSRPPGSTPGPAPGGAPGGGTLISTGNVGGGGGGGLPGSNLASDRLKSNAWSDGNTNVSQTLRNVLGANQSVNQS